MFEDVKDLYNTTVLERGRNPAHMHRLESFDATAKGDNPLCGDRVQVWVKYTTDGAIAETGFEARGCEISRASADLMVEAVAGRDKATTKGLYNAFQTLVRTGACPDCAEALNPLRPLSGVHEYPSRIKCATLPWRALMAALDDDGKASIA